MEIVPLAPALEHVFWRHVNQDIPHYYFFALDWKYDKDVSKILLALEGNRVDAMMLVYRQSIVQLRGSDEAVRALLERLDVEEVELQAEEQHEQRVLEKYKAAIRHKMILMTLNKNGESLQLVHPVVELCVSDSEEIALLMRLANPEAWGDTTSQRIVEGMRRVSWFGIVVNGELVSIGSVHLTEWGGLIGVVATHGAHMNRGYATSVVSKLVEQIFENRSMAMIYVLADNLPAVRVYEKVGFKPYREYFFMRGEKR